MTIIKTADFQIDRVLEKPPVSGDFSKALLGSKSAQDLEIRERFVKFAKNLKAVAPKANDFTYFSAVMLHSAEASLVDDDGNIKKDANGNDISAKWEIDEKTGGWKWVCSDPNIKAYKNNNGDIFPEVELKKAYRKWVGRPLCKDHKSSSVDGIRGIIVDTYYDDKFKRVIGLCALDKVNYPDLARKVETGYANNVSMGTAVGKSICYTCGNVAQVESDYCEHVRGRTTYGEINVDLSPIELSIVVTGADPKAKLRNVIASLNRYSDEKKSRIDELKRAGCVTPQELLRLESEVEELRSSVNAVLSLQKEASNNPEKIEQARNLGEVLKTVTDPKVRDTIEARIEELLNDEEQKEETVFPPYGVAGNKEMTGGHDMLGRDMESSGPPEYAMEHRNNTLASENFSLEIKGIHNKLGAMEEALRDLAKGVHNNDTDKEAIMSNAKLMERARARRAMLKKAYHQGGGGVNDPQTYPVDPENDKLKTKGDKQMEGTPMETGKDGLHPGDLELKKKLSRAELDERKLKREALLKSAEELESTKTNDGKTVAKLPDGKVVMLNSDGSWAEVSDKEVQEARDLVKAVGKGKKVEAYHQGGGGVNEPQTYPVDPENDKLKTKGDKQMEGTPMETGKDGLHPGDLELKKKHLRASFKLAKVAGKTDRGNSKWTVFADDEIILEATGAEAFEDELDANWSTFASERYGREVLRAIRSEGLSKVARLLKGDELTKTALDPMTPDADPMTPDADPMASEALPPADTDALEDKADDPVEAALNALTEHLQETEKALGDLKDAMQEKSGDTEADLPSPAEVSAHDGHELVSALDESADELSLLAEALETRTKAGKTAGDATVDELLRLSKTASEDNVSFREQAAELIAEAAKKKEKKEDKDEEKEDKKKEKEDKKEDKDEEKEDKDDEKEDKKKKSKAEVMLDKLLKSRASARRQMARTAMDEDIEEELRKLREDVDALMSAEREEVDEDGDPEHPELMGDDSHCDLSVEEESIDMDALDAQLAQLLDEEEGDDDDEAMAADDEEDEMPKTAEERRAWREKVAAEVAEEGKKLDLGPAVAKETDMPLAESTDLSQLDINTDEARVEGIEEQYNKIMREVQNLPKVREAVNHMVKLMRVGALGAGDLDNTEKLEVLAVDPAAAKYWKEYFGQGDKDSSSFGTELTKEMTHKKAQASVAEQRARLRRAYDVAVEMQEKGMIDDGVDSLHKQADAIASLDDKGFEAMKKALARVSAAKQVKTASPAIQVGINEDDNAPAEVGLVEQLRRMW